METVIIFSLVFVIATVFAWPLFCKREGENGPIATEKHWVVKKFGEPDVYFMTDAEFEDYVTNLEKEIERIKKDIK